MALGLALLLLALSAWLERAHQRALLRDLAVGRVEAVLHEKERLLDRLAAELGDSLQARGHGELFRLFNPVHETLYDREGLALFLYKGEDLVYWSQNSIPIEPRYSEASYHKNSVFLRIKNSDFLPRRYDLDGGYHLLGLVLVKSGYEFEDEHFVGGFNPDLGIPPRVGLAVGGDQIVHNLAGDELFSLVIPDDLARDSYSPRALEAFFVGLLLLLLAAHWLFGLLKRARRPGWMTLALAALVLALRLAMMELEWPGMLKATPLFQAQYFGRAPWFPSLGDLLISALLIFLLPYHLLDRIDTGLLRDRLARRGRWLASLAVFASLVALQLYFIFVHYLFKILVWDSTISFEVYDFALLDDAKVTLVAFVIIGFLFAGLMVVLDKLVLLCARLAEVQWFAVLAFFSLLLLWPYTSSLEHGVDLRSIVFYTVMLTIVAFIRFRRMGYQYYTHIFLVFLVSVYTVFFTLSNSDEREKQKRLTRMENLTETDVFAEEELRNFLRQLEPDLAASGLLASAAKGQAEIATFVRDRYFSFYFPRKYDVRVELCLSGPEGADVDSCAAEKLARIADQSRSLDNNPYFRFISKKNGSTGYFATKFVEMEGLPRAAVSVWVMSKPTEATELGYQRVLANVNEQSRLWRYSIARYVNGTLAASSGEYAYDLGVAAFARADTSVYFLNTEQDDHNHLVRREDSLTLWVMTKPNLKEVDLVISFSYIFVFFYVLFNLVLFLQKLPIKRGDIKFDFRLRIQFSLISVLSLALLVIGGGTISYNGLQYRLKNQGILDEKTQSIQRALRFEQQSSALLAEALAQGARLDPLSEQAKALQAELKRLASIFSSEIHLYDRAGTLMASSVPEVFEAGLQGPMMNPEAFLQMRLLNKGKHAQVEFFGSYEYLSAYVPLFDPQNELLAYLDIPHFYQQEFFDITPVIAAMVNIYALFILLAIVVAVFISNRIAHPLHLIQEKLKQVRLGKANEQIFYDKDDEVGSLIKEYNRMVSELARSVEKLAKSEREVAWREMAKQIAHEIKNPLTPMKLSIQMLERSWEDEDERFGSRLRRTTETLIDQIERLSAIATSFSNFAKMPTAENVVLDLEEVVAKCVQLFEAEEVDISLELFEPRSFPVFADGKLLSQAFINLVKNGIQAVPDDRDAEIKVAIFTNRRTVTVRIGDNGSGIPEHLKDKLFQPNFTTKSSGMGLGLSIVKSIVENARGNIWFVTKLDKGSTFFVELPLATPADAAEASPAAD